MRQRAAGQWCARGMTENDCHAALVAEMREAKFPDRRLCERQALMTSRLASDPSRSFPDAFTSAELEGAYRFFGNPRVTPDAILSAHFEHTSRRCADEPAVLVVHDTSTFAFDPDGEREGLGRVRKLGQAFFGHLSLVLSDDGTRRPLGVAALATWVRGEAPSRNEKARWWQSIQLSAERLGGPRTLVHVMDREADDYSLFAHLIEGDHRFVVRLAQNRLLAQSTLHDPRKLHDAAARIECVVERNAKLSKRVDRARAPKQKAIHPSRATRVAKLAIGATRITLKRPETKDKTEAPSLALNLVRVWEPEPPEDQEPIEWLLATNEPVDSVEALTRCVERYRARWTIEEYFKAIKTGCAFSERQLGDYEGLVNALALFAPIACCLLALRTRAQRDATAPATAVLEPTQLEVLRALGRKPLPAHPTAREALLAIAALGGHIRWSGEPGWRTLARGYSELLTLTRGWIAAKLPPACDQR